MTHRKSLVLIIITAVAILSGANRALAEGAELDKAVTRKEGTIRFATFNVSLAGRKRDEILTRLEQGADSQAKAVAEIIQRVRPDVLFLNELDFDAEGKVLTAFVDRYLAVPQGVGEHDQAKPIEFAHRFIAPVNTGLATGFDLDQDGVRGAAVGTDAYARDARGFGLYPGQYGMAVLSNFPIDREHVRTFRKFLWRDMPDARLPKRPDGAAWYATDVLNQLPLSSKSHWDVPIVILGQTVHLLASHPTPPVFDGPEDRNGCRNHDEIRFWADYLTPASAKYIVDDNERRGGLAESASFVIVGDLNSDPEDGEETLPPIRQLLGHERVNAKAAPMSLGAVAAADRQGGKNGEHRGDAANDTGDFADEKGPGNLRLDYVLPSKDLSVCGTGVYWPRAEDPSYRLVGPGHPVVSSDHRLVWLDVEAPKAAEPAP